MDLYPKRFWWFSFVCNGFYTILLNRSLLLGQKKTQLSTIVVVLKPPVACISSYDEILHGKIQGNTQLKTECKKGTTKTDAYDTLACNDYWFSVSEIHHIVACSLHIACSNVSHCESQSIAYYLRIKYKRPRSSCFCFSDFITLHFFSLICWVGSLSFFFSLLMILFFTPFLSFFFHEKCACVPRSTHVSHYQRYITKWWNTCITLLHGRRSEQDIYCSKYRFHTIYLYLFDCSIYFWSVQQGHRR